MGHRLLKDAPSAAAAEGSLELDERFFLAKWRETERHLQAHYVHGGRAPALGTVVELGRDRFPVVSVGLALSGARRVMSFDPAPLLPPGPVVATMRMFRRWVDAGRLQALEPDAAERLDDLLGCGPRQPASWLLEALGIRLRRGAGRRTGLGPGTVDLFVSSGVLERAPVAALFAEFRRVAHAGSVMSHLVRRDAARHVARRHHDTRWMLLEQEACDEGTWLTAAASPQLLH